MTRARSEYCKLLKFTGLEGPLWISRAREAPGCSTARPRSAGPRGSRPGSSFHHGQGHFADGAWYEMAPVAEWGLDDGEGGYKVKVR